MKKSIVLAFFLIIAGCSLWIASTVSCVRMINVKAGELETREWEAFGNFTRGDIMYITMTQGLNWAAVLEPPGYKWVYLEVFDPDQGSIRFEVEYVAWSSVEGGPPLNPTFVRIDRKNTTCLGELWQNQTNFSGGGFVAGEVLVNGTYRVKIVGFLPPSGDEFPPSSLQLRKIVKNIDYPYRPLFYFGVGLITIGIITAFYSRRRVSKLKGKFSPYK